MFLYYYINGLGQSLNFTTHKTGNSDLRQNVGQANFINAQLTPNWGSGNIVGLCFFTNHNWSPPAFPFGCSVYRHENHGIGTVILHRWVLWKLRGQREHMRLGKCHMEMVFWFWALLNPWNNLLTPVSLNPLLCFIWTRWTLKL